MANVLYELSWNGYEYETVNKNQEKMIKDLENSQKEIDEHPENLKDFNEIRKELGMPEHTREEKEFIRRIHEYISDEYEKEMKVILGFEKQKHE